MQIPRSSVHTGTRRFNDGRLPVDQLQMEQGISSLLYGLPRRPGRFSRRMVLVVSRIPSGEFRGLAAVCFNKYDLAAIGRSIDRERSSASQMESSKRGNRP